MILAQLNQAEVFSQPCIDLFTVQVGSYIDLFSKRVHTRKGYLAHKKTLPSPMTPS